MDVQQVQSLLRAKGIQVKDGDLAFDLLKLNEVVLENIRTDSRIDTAKMQNLLLQKGIRVTPDDPIFTFLALNGIVLENMSRKHKLALDQAAAQRFSGHQQNFIYLKILSVAVFAFGIGMFFGGSAVSYLGIGTVGIALGVALGATGSLLIIGRDPLAKRCSTCAIQLIRNSWTEIQLNRVVAGMSPPLSPRVLEACLDVLIGSAAVPNAAAKARLFPGQVERALHKIAQRSRYLKGKSWN